MEELAKAAADTLSAVSGSASLGLAPSMASRMAPTSPAAADGVP
jgi:hypothetical protein